MKKLNQNGFGIVGIVFVIVVIGLIGGTGYLVFTKQANKKTTPNSNQASQNDTKSVFTPCYSYKLPKNAVTKPAAGQIARCDSKSYFDHAKDIDIATVTGLTSVSSGFEAAVKSRESLIHNMATNVTRNDIKIDGLSTVKFTFSPTSSPYKQVFVMIDADKGVDDDFVAFTIDGHYHNDLYQSAFDDLINSWKWVK